MDKIILTKHEIQSGLNRQRVAEGLIVQLPKNHEGRNSWLLNYGIGAEASTIRDRHPAAPIKMDIKTEAAIYKEK